MSDALKPLIDAGWLNAQPTDAEALYRLAIREVSAKAWYYEATRFAVAVRVWWSSTHPELVMAPHDEIGT